MAVSLALLLHLLTKEKFAHWRIEGLYKYTLQHTIFSTMLFISTNIQILGFTHVMCYRWRIENSTKTWYLANTRKEQYIAVETKKSILQQLIRCHIFNRKGIFYRWLSKTIFFLANFIDIFSHNHSTKLTLCINNEHMLFSDLDEWVKVFILKRYVRLQSLQQRI